MTLPGTLISLPGEVAFAAVPENAAFPFAEEHLNYVIAWPSGFRRRLLLEPVR
jgi:hypothetical protein